MLPDAQKRYQHDLDFPNEPKQLLPGENVTMVDGKVQILRDYDGGNGE